MSKTKISSYEDLLFQMQNYRGSDGDTFPRPAELVFQQNQVYDIDLNTRTINTPEFLSVQFEHNAEVIYLKCPRYYENMDLANTVCVIEYLNASHTEGKATKRDAGLFWVPYFDLSRCDEIIEEDGQMIANPVMYIPWSIGGLATAYPGKVTFTVRFYKLNKTPDGDFEYLFNMSTKPRDGEVLHGLDFTEAGLDGDGTNFYEEFKLETSVVEQIYSEMQTAMSYATTTWIEL